MGDLDFLEKIGTDAVKKLRSRKLQSGKPFMINSKELPAKHSYLEFPDSTIKEVTIAENLRSFEIIRQLSQNEAQIIRKKFNLV